MNLCMNSLCEIWILPARAAGEQSTRGRVRGLLHKSSSIPHASSQLKLPANFNLSLCAGALQGLTLRAQLSKMACRQAQSPALGTFMSKGQQPRKPRRTLESQGDVAIPDKLFFRIGEVSNLTRTKPYVLRYWESEFPMLKPSKSRTGHRLYRRQDVETVFEIKRLLYEKGFTIDGARKHLAGEMDGSDESATSVGSSSVGQHLRTVRRELLGILTILSRKC
jgi:DNA-binding transcriptional MerR regulator